MYMYFCENLYMYMLLIICYTFNVRWKRYYYVHPHYKKKGGALMPLTENQKQSRYNYAKKALKRIPLDVQKEKYEEIKAAADNAGEPVNGYIKKAIDERMERDSQALLFAAAPSATVQQTIPDQPAPSLTAASRNTSQKPRKPFTKEAAEQIDTGKLLNDFRYQLDIGLAYGNDVLTRLLNEARQQSIK